MKDETFPALYSAADAASNAAQKSLLVAHQINYLLLIGGSVSALFGPSRWFAVLSAVLFLGSLLMYVYIQHSDFQGLWYRARALAESVKTSTWRLMMCAQPFSNADETENVELFRKLLIELLQENKGIGKHLAGDWSGKDQITGEMMLVLRESYALKKQRYQNDRIENQRKWYAKKSGDNRKASAWFFHLTCLAYGAAISLLLFKIVIPDALYLPIEVFAVIASSLIGWKQIKRFDELSSAYGLTAHELGIVKSRFESVADAAHLSEFVRDAENAFSREHTQWAARRDNQ